MSSRLPEFADPWRLCEQGKVFPGRVALAALGRLAPLLVDPAGEAVFELRFERDNGRNRHVRGRVQASLALECQRCLGPMNLDVDASFDLVLVRGLEEAERLADEFEPLLVENDQIIPMELVEDELLLAIPASPLHPPSECSMDLTAVNALVDDVPESTAQTDERDNPFAALADWQGRPNKPD